MDKTEHKYIVSGVVLNKPNKAGRIYQPKSFFNMDNYFRIKNKTILVYLDTAKHNAYPELDQWIGHVTKLERHCDHIRATVELVDTPMTKLVELEGFENTKLVSVGVGSVDKMESQSIVRDYTLSHFTVTPKR